MPLVLLVLVLIIVGVLLWFLESGKIPMDATIKRIIEIVVIVVVIYWLLKQLGIIDLMMSIRV